MTAENNNDILIEANDCCGKDTLAAVVARDLDITKVQKLMLVENNPYDIDIHPVALPDQALCGVYLARAVMYDIEHHSHSADVTQLQISWAGTRSGAYLAGFPTGLGPVFDDLLNYAPLFENAFLLTASVDAKRQRLIAKGELATAHDRLMLNNPERVARMEGWMVENASKKMGATVIDTSRMAPDEVATVVKETIAGLRPRDTVAGVRVDIKDLRPDQAYFEKELDKFWSFIVKTKALNI